MTHYRPKRGLRFWLRGREHVVRKRLDNGELQICDIRTEQISAISEADFYALYFKDELSYEPPSSPESTEAKKIDYLSADFTYIEENLKVVARKRFAYVNRFYQEDVRVRTEESLAPIITVVAKEIGDDKPPNWRTLHRWITSYEKAERDVRALIPKHSSKGVRSRLDPAVRSIIEEAIDEVYLTPTKATIADAISHVNYKITKENMLRQRLGQEPLQLSGAEKS